MALSTAEADLQIRLTGPHILHWFIQVRWAIVILLTLGGVLTWAMGAVPANRFAEGLAVAGGVLLYNGVFWLLVRRADEGHPAARTLVRWVQLPCDIITTTLLLHIIGSGGISPFTVLYGITVLGAVTLLPPRGIVAISLFATLCYGGLLVYEFFLSVPGPADTLLLFYRTHPEPGRVAMSAFIITALAINSAAFATVQFARRLRTSEAVIQRQVADLTMLQRMAHDQVATLNVDEVLQKITDSTQVLLNADLVSVVLRRPDGRVEFRVISGPAAPQWSPTTILPLPDSNPVLAHLLSGRPLLVPDVQQQPAVRSLLLRPQTVSFYSFPLIVEQQAIGALNFSFDHPYALPPGTQTMLLALTDQAALALARARLYQEATQAAREMSSLYHIGLATSSTLDIGEVLLQIYQQVHQVLHPDTFLIALNDPASGELCFELVVEQGRQLPLHKVPLGLNSMSGWVAQTRQPLLIGYWDMEEGRIPPKRRVYGLDSQSILAVPLIAKDKVIGVMSAQQVQPYAFNEDNLRLLSAIAAQAALALENARLHEEVRERAVRDSLTGAYNHGALIERLTAAIEAAMPHGHSVALIMLDVDHFKAFNDQWGHQAGDAALQALVAAVTAQLKRGDTVGRWGGEEFGVVLPGATQAQAAQIAARIQATLAAVSLIGPEGQPWPTPTVSQGVACFPDHATSAALLVDVADHALYTAKAQGRNSIVVASPAAPPKGVADVTEATLEVSNRQLEIRR
jgi:diguanylate cyclase (GGDEF)-like protein